MRTTHVDLIPPPPPIGRARAAKVGFLDSHVAPSELKVASERTVCLENRGGAKGQDGSAGMDGRTSSETSGWRLTGPDTGCRPL